MTDWNPSIVLIVPAAQIIDVRDASEMLGHFDDVVAANELHRASSEEQAQQG